jgi:glutathione S-transferase
VINEYLEDRFPQPPLRPADPAARARMRLIVKIIDDEIHPAIGVLSYAVFLRHQMNARMSPEELAEHFRRVTDPARRERQQSTHETGLESPGAAGAVAALQRLVAHLDEALGQDANTRADREPWLAGDRYSLADAAAVPYMIRAQALGLTPLWAARPAVGAWLQRAIDHAQALPVGEVFGSDAFHAMVADYAAQEAPGVEALLAAAGVTQTA